MSQSVLLDDQQKVVSDFRRLKLDPIADTFESQFLNPAIYDEMNFTQRIQAAADAQSDFAAHKRFTNIVRRAALQYKVDLCAIRPDEKNGPTAATLRMLTQMRYAVECRTVYICGPTGSGKTLLANAACMSAARKGMTVRFCRMSDLIVSLEAKDGIGRQRLRDNLAKFKILVLDDYGINAISASTASALLSIVDMRYNRGATIVTSQLKFSAVADAVSGDSEHVKDALIDRLFPANTCVIELTGASRRGSSDELRGDEI